MQTCAGRRGQRKKAHSVHWVLRTQVRDWSDAGVGVSLELHLVGLELRRAHRSHHQQTHSVTECREAHITGTWLQ